VAAFAVIALAQAKFYLLFAFLFGYSLSFMLDAGDPASIRRFYRRLMGLALIGIAHAVFFFVGDILVLYAMLGLMLPWLARKPDVFVLRAAIVAGGVWLLLLSAVVAATVLWPDDGAAMRAEVAHVDSAFATGNFWRATQTRLAVWPATFGLIAVLNGLGVLTMFFVGLLAGRRKLLAHVHHHAPLWRAGLWWGFACGMPLSLAAAWLQIGPHANPETPGATETLGVALCFAAAPLLSWAYVSLLAHIFLYKPRLLAIFQPEGRMSLTIYVGESIALSLLFCGYGLGWFGKVGAASVALIAIAVWAILCGFAALWQKHFSQGPLEALLRAWVTRQ
jgi:uncharacterized protein